MTNHFCSFTQNYYERRSKSIGLCFDDKYSEINHDLCCWMKKTREQNYKMYHKSASNNNERWHNLKECDLSIYLLPLIFGSQISHSSFSLWFSYIHSFFCTSTTVIKTVTKWIYSLYHFIKFLSLSADRFLYFTVECCINFLIHFKAGL